MPERGSRAAADPRNDAGAPEVAAPESLHVQRRKPPHKRGVFQDDTPGDGHTFRVYNCTGHQIAEMTLEAEISDVRLDPLWDILDQACPPGHDAGLCPHDASLVLTLGSQMTVLARPFLVFLAADPASESLEQLLELVRSFLVVRVAQSREALSSPPPSR